MEELALQLSEMYENAAPGNKVTMIHLFGIINAATIENNNYSIREIIELSELHHSYATELRKGIKLAQFVNPI